MRTFDIKSLFTNVPLDEAIKICTEQLYHSETEVPTLSEKSFVKLMEKVTKGVEFSFDGVMFKQTDGVAMGSPLGPVLANIFVGYLEQKLNIDDREELLLYKRYVDDTFSLHLEEEQSSKFFEDLNNLHPALVFSRDQEKDRTLPFLDVAVHKKLPEVTEQTETTFETSIYRKPTFTGQYTLWDLFSARRYKINLIKCLVGHATWICSPNLFTDELNNIRCIFSRNG